MINLCGKWRGIYRLFLIYFYLIDWDWVCGRVILGNNNIERDEREIYCYRDIEKIKR